MPQKKSGKKGEKECHLILIYEIAVSGIDSTNAVKIERDIGDRRSRLKLSAPLSMLATERARSASQPGIEESSPSQ